MENPEESEKSEAKQPEGESSTRQEGDGAAGGINKEKKYGLTYEECHRKGVKKTRKILRKKKSPLWRGRSWKERITNKPHSSINIWRPGTVP